MGVSQTDDVTIFTVSPDSRVDVISSVVVAFVGVTSLDNGAEWSSSVEVVSTGVDDTLVVSSFDIVAVVVPTSLFVVVMVVVCSLVVRTSLVVWSSVVKTSLVVCSSVVKTSLVLCSSVVVAATVVFVLSIVVGSS